MSFDLSDHIHQQLRRRKSDRDIRNDLIDRGYTEEYADQAIARARAEYSGRREQRRQAAREVRKEEQSVWGKTALSGLGLIALGVIFCIIGLFVEGLGWSGPAGRGAFGIGLVGGIGMGSYLVVKGFWHKIRFW